MQVRAPHLGPDAGQRLEDLTPWVAEAVVPPTETTATDGATDDTTSRSEVAARGAGRAGRRRRARPRSSRAPAGPPARGRRAAAPTRTRRPRAARPSGRSRPPEPPDGSPAGGHSTSTVNVPMSATCPADGVATTASPGSSSGRSGNAVPERTHLDLVEHPLEPDPVVRVLVGLHNNVQRPDPAGRRRTSAPRGRRRRRRRRAAARPSLDQDRVALADVDRRDHQSRRRTTADHGQREGRDGQQSHGERRGTQPPPRPDRHRHGADDRDEQQRGRAAPAPGTAPPDAPPTARRGAATGRARARVPPRSATPGQARPRPGAHRRDGCRRYGHQVGGHRSQGTSSNTRSQDGDHTELCRHRHRQQLCDAARQSEAARRRRHGVSAMMPAVAPTERSRPTLVARYGSSSTRTVTANPSTCQGCRDDPPNPAARNSATIAAARSTEGSARVSTTNHPTPATTATRRSRLEPPTPTTTSAIAVTTIATFDPDTATRWVSPASCSRASTSAGRSEVSPSPGRWRARPCPPAATASSLPAVAAGRARWSATTPRVVDEPRAPGGVHARRDGGRAAPGRSRHGPAAGR